MKVTDLKAGMIVRFPEDGFSDDKAKVIKIDNVNRQVFFRDVEEEFDFNASFEEVEQIVKPF